RVRSQESCKEARLGLATVRQPVDDRGALGTHGGIESHRELLDLAVSAAAPSPPRLHANLTEGGHDPLTLLGSRIAAEGHASECVRGELLEVAARMNSLAG